MSIESRVLAELFNEQQALQWPIPGDWPLYQRPTLFRREGCRYFPVSIPGKQTPPDVLPILKTDLAALVSSY